MKKLSVVIITFNEEANIARCIDSVKDVADEVIVLDSMSSDKTIAIAREKKARVFVGDFKGYIDQKNKALQLASYDYVLSLDGDEAIDEQLAKSIQYAKKNFMFSAYSMNRCTNYCGQFIRFGTWYPDRKVRLFEKKIAKWGGLDPHDKVLLPDRTAIFHLKGNILHYSYESVAAHNRQNEHFSTIAANSYRKAGKRTNPFKIVINPLWAFAHDYIIRAGFLNGKHGLVIAFKQAQYTYKKHIKLFRLQRKQGAPVVSIHEAKNNSNNMKSETDAATPSAIIGAR
jgi:glycosyltransferase involved in cell wall biosynthesis